MTLKDFFPLMFCSSRHLPVYMVQRVPMICWQWNTYSLVKPVPFKIISLSPFPILEVPFKGCLLNHFEFICCIPNGVLSIWNLPPFNVTFISWSRKSLEGIDQENRNVVGEQELVLCEEFSSTVLCELMHCHDESATFLHFHVFFMLCNSHTSKLPDNKLH